MKQGAAPRRTGRRPAAALSRTRALVISAAVAVLAVGALPGSAPGQGTGEIPNWPELLPPNPNNSSGTVWPGFDSCPAGDIDCPPEVILEMYERWRPLSHACDHRAVFALTYLRTTEEFLRTVQGEPTFFDDPPWVNHEDAVFAEFYFQAEDAYGEGGAVPEAWRIAFESASSPNVTGPGDLLLGMNAHINRDLPFTLAAVGLVPPGGGSRKTDHDRVNFFLNRIADPLQEELGARYDPFFTTTDAGPSPFDELAVLQTVRAFRQGAWQNAERLVNAASEGERAQVAADIEGYSAATANAIVAGNTMPGYGPTRDAWCREHNPHSAAIEFPSDRLRGLVRSRRLPLDVFADGPARFELHAVLERPRGRTAAKRGKIVELTRGGRVEFDALGWQGTSLKLTRSARRLLKPRRWATITVVLRAPHGFRVEATQRFRRRKADVQ
jgi:Family of unknown function (DUF5995)